MLTFEKNENMPIAIYKGGGVTNTLYFDGDDVSCGFTTFVAPAGATLHCATVPRKGQRRCLFIIGTSGCGKTTFCAKYARDYIDQHDPTYHVVLICQDRDKVFAKFTAKEMIHLTPADLIKREIKMKDLIKCLVIFDDIHSIANKAELKAVLLETILYISFISILIGTNCSYVT